MMMRVIKILCAILLFFSYAQQLTGQINVINQSVAGKVTDDSQSQEKKSKVIKCLALASMGTKNLVVEHMQDAAKIIFGTPDSENEIIYQQDSVAPEDYIAFFKKELFSKKCWKQIESGESGLRQQCHDAIYKSYESQLKKKRNVSANELKILENSLSDFAYKVVDRFILPNYKALFINNMYYHHEFKDGNTIEIKEYIKKEDLPLVIEALKGM